MKIRKIYVVGALHGDELFGLKVLARLQASRSIMTRVGHLEAIARGVRFLETDLNRSFHPDAAPSLEAAIAKQIMAEIEQYGPDLILDLHTSRGKVGKVGITASSSPLLASLASALHLDQVVSMPEDIAKDSLIGQYPDRALSLEFGIHHRSNKLAITIAEAIQSLPDLLLQQDINIPQYAVTRAIGNHEAIGETLENYIYNETLNGYPFLVGKNTYQEFRGFLAQKL